MDEYEKALCDIGIEFEAIPHPEYKDAHALMDFLHISAQDTIPTLVMKAGDDFVVVLRRGDTRLDYKKLRSILGKNVRMATPEEFQDLTGLQPGSARVYAPGLTTYIDGGVLEAGELYGGSGSFTKTIRYNTISLQNIPGVSVVDICQ